MLATDWTVLVIIGATASGKSTLAREIGLQLGIPWLQADDVRLALAHSPLVMDDDAFFFDRVPLADWSLDDADVLRDRMIATSEAMRASMRIIIANHLTLGDRCVIEGDCMHPDLVRDPELAAAIANGSLRVICLDGGGAAEISASLLARARQLNEARRAEIGQIAAFHALYAAWMRETSRRHRIPIVTSRPFGTLADRVLATI